MTTEREKLIEAIFQSIGEWSASGVLTPSTVLINDITDAVDAALASRDAEVAQLREDAERLDWIESVDASEFILSCGRRWYWRSAGSNGKP